MRLSVQQLHDVITGSHRDVFEIPDVQGQMDKFLDALDEESDFNRDGYVELKDLRPFVGIFNRCFDRHLSGFLSNKDADSLRATILKAVLPPDLMTAEAFLIRNGLYHPQELHVIPHALDTNAEIRPVSDRNKVKAEFDRLPEDEKLRVVAALLGVPVNQSLGLFPVLFPTAGFPVYEDMPRAPDIRASFRSIDRIKDAVSEWHISGGESASEEKTRNIRLIIAANLAFLKMMDEISEMSPSRGAGRFEAVREEMERVLSPIYHSHIFDTDFDGAPDGFDPFPVLARYSRDVDKKGFPAELTEVRKGPDNFFGLKEGDVRCYQGQSHLHLHRVGDRLFLVLNVRLEPYGSRYALPRLRYQWKKYIEEDYKKILSKLTDLPVTVLVDFHVESGEPVEVPNTPALDLTQAAHSGAWPTGIKRGVLRHEVGHHLLWPDRYFSSPYIGEHKAFSPGLPVLWRKRHLMDGDTKYIEAGDMIFTLDIVSHSEKTPEGPTLATAEIQTHVGRYEEAIRIYSEIYTQNKLDSGAYFLSPGDEELTAKETLAVEAMKGMIRCQIELVRQSHDAELVTGINDNIGILEDMGRAQVAKSAEAQAAIVDALIFRGKIAKEQGRFEEAFDYFEEARGADKVNRGELALSKISDLTGVQGLQEPFLKGRVTSGVFVGELNPKDSGRFHMTRYGLTYPISGEKWEFNLGASLSLLLNREGAAGLGMGTLSIERRLPWIVDTQIGLQLSGGGIVNGNGVTPYIEGAVLYAIEGSYLFAGGVGATFIDRTPSFTFFITLGYEMPHSLPAKSIIRRASGVR